MLRALFVLALAACQQAHVVTLQLGPTAGTLSNGFNCFQDGSMMLLAQRARQPDGSMLFGIVVDIIGLGGQLPGCRGEELFAACEAGDCAIVPRDDGTRYCVTVEVDPPIVDEAIAGNLVPMLEVIRDALDEQKVTLDAPDEPVVIRSVATAVKCEDMTTMDFDLDQLVGCAYSCPVQLDEVDGPIALSLDTLTRACEREVRACAIFPP